MAIHFYIDCLLFGVHLDLESSLAAVFMSPRIAPSSSPTHRRGIWTQHVALRLYYLHYRTPLFIGEDFDGIVKGDWEFKI